jgi:hypothetical protein
MHLLLLLPAEMNYDATSEVEPAGEVLLRGPQLFSGYYKAVGDCWGCTTAAAAAAGMAQHAVVPRCIRLCTISLQARLHGR